MDRLRQLRLRCVSYIMAGMFILLAFPSCMDDTGKEPLEYNLRNARFEITGKVVNSKNEPVSDIQLIFKGITGTTYSEFVNTTDTLTSGNDGKFTFIDTDALTNARYRIIHRDIDAAGNLRYYKTDSVNVEMPKPTNNTANGNHGTASAEVIITLKEKAPENNN